MPLGGLIAAQHYFSSDVQGAGDLQARVRAATLPPSPPRWRLGLARDCEVASWRLAGKKQPACFSQQLPAL